MKPQELQLDRDAFLARYWQREPLLIRGAIPDFEVPLDAGELAGLAMEEAVESRIIEFRDRQWQLQHGPFAETDYHREGPWTLLVQAVDHYLPEVAALRRLVDFLPQWRVDDVMVSYASDGGSVGPHYDNYDVFLLQGEGERHWQIGPWCDESTPLADNPALRILASFSCEAEYTLQTGDILYLPPGVAHWGIARGECTTFSIGFRAPSISAMVSRWADQLLEELEPGQFYRDFRSAPALRPGEIRPADLQRAQAQLQGALDQASGSRWFGELVTEPRYDAAPEEAELAAARKRLFTGSVAVTLCPAAKLAWQREAEGVRVFANGESSVFPGSVLTPLMKLCEHWQLEREQLATAMESVETATLLDYLLQSGCIYVE